MNKTLINLLATVFFTSSITVIAATTPDTNKDDASNLGTSDTPQIKQQDKRMDKKSMSNKNKNRSGSSSNSSDQMMESNKKMDTNSDGMISKDEYMAHQEMTYGSMKQGDGGVSLSDMHSGMIEDAQTGGLEGKPVGGADRARTGNKY